MQHKRNCKQTLDSGQSLPQVILEDLRLLYLDPFDLNNVSADANARKTIAGAYQLVSPVSLR